MSMYICALVCTLKCRKKWRNRIFFVCMHVSMYACLCMMIDLRSIQSMYSRTCRCVYCYIPWGSSYLGIDTHYIDEDKRSCNRDGQSYSPCSFIELKEIKRTDIDLNSCIIRRRWFPPWERMPCLICINQLSLFHYPKRLDE